MNLSYADLRYVDFGTADLSTTQLQYAMMPHWSQIKDATLPMSFLENAYIPDDWPQAVVDLRGFDKRRLCDPVGGLICYTQLLAR